jgi:O-glycosyl hydrolase
MNNLIPVNHFRKKHLTGLLLISSLISCVGVTNAQQVDVLATSGTKSALLQKQAPANFTDGIIVSHQLININDTLRYQSVDGLGYALTQGSAAALMKMESGARAQLLREMFDPKNGNSVSMLRITLGASDLSTSLYTYAEAKVSNQNFTPDPNKRYYIDVPAHGLRIGATGASEDPYTAANAPRGADFEWQFVPAGDGLWFIDRATGGSVPRLRTDDTNMADMNEKTIGTWERWQLSPGENVGTYFLSLPQKGVGNHDRLQVDNNFLVRMVDNDRSAGTWESFTFTEVGGANNFSLEGPDTETLIPVLKEILAINPNIKILATPWTAPRWMKTNNAWVGGSLKPEHYGDYAQYFIQYLDAMKQRGIPIWGITPQNEPENNHNEPSMSMTAEQQFTLVDQYLGPQLENAGYGQVKLIGFDHNCDNTDFPTRVAQSHYVDGSAFHLYAGDISAMSTVKSATGKDVYFTEQYTGFPKGDAVEAFNGDLGWHMENVVIGSLRNWSKTVLEWNLVTSPPTTANGCVDCLGAVTLTGSASLERNVSYYIISQLSRYLKPGAVRIDSGGIVGNLHHVAFKNTDGSYVLLAYNASTEVRGVTVAMNGRSFAHTVPARTAITFRWVANAEPKKDIHIEAEAYSAMQGVKSQSTTDLGGGKNVGWISPGDWMNYSVDIPVAGTYNVRYRLASSLSGGSFRLELNGKLIDIVVVPQTLGSQTWVDVNKRITIPASGKQQLRIVAINGGWNINWFKLSKM